MEEMKKVFETNFFGVIRMIKEVMPDMKRRKGGHIIVVSSVMGLQGEQTEVGVDERRERRRAGALNGTGRNDWFVSFSLTYAWVDDGQMEEWVDR